MPPPAGRRQLLSAFRLPRQRLAEVLPSRQVRPPSRPAGRGPGRRSQGRSLLWPSGILALHLSPEACHLGHLEVICEQCGSRDSPAGQSGRTDYANGVERRSARNTGAHCLGHFKARSSCSDLSPRTCGCHTNVIIAKHRIGNTPPSEFISSLWAKVSPPRQVPKPQFSFGWAGRGKGELCTGQRLMVHHVPFLADAKTLKRVPGGLSAAR